MTALSRAVSSNAPRTLTTLTQPTFGLNYTSLSRRVQQAARNFHSHTPLFSKIEREVKQADMNNDSYLFRAKKASEVIHAATELPRNKNAEIIRKAAQLELADSLQGLRNTAETHFVQREFENALNDYSQLMEFDPEDPSIAKMIELSKKYTKETFPTW